MTMYEDFAWETSQRQMHPYNDDSITADGKDVIIASGTLTVSAVDEDLRGKEHLVVKDGAAPYVGQLSCMG